MNIRDHKELKSKSQAMKWLNLCEKETRLQFANRLFFLSLSNRNKKAKLRRRADEGKS